MRRFFKKPKIFVIGKKIGGCSNRLFLFANLISCALENNAIVFNPSFEEYAKYFVNTGKDIFCRYPPKNFSFIGMKFWRKIYYILILKITSKIKNPGWFYSISLPAQKGIYCEQDYPRKFFYLENLKFKKKIENKLIILFKGLYFWDGENLAKHHSEIVRYFRPLPKYEKKTKERLAYARKTYQILVGVHIRRGDYRK